MLYSNNRSFSKLKHINFKFLVVKERVHNGQLFIKHGQLPIKHIGTNSMIDDFRTKGLPSKVFHEHTASMGVILYEGIRLYWEFIF